VWHLVELLISYSQNTISFLQYQGLYHSMTDKSPQGRSGPYALVFSLCLLLGPLQKSLRIAASGSLAITLLSSNSISSLIPRCRYFAPPELVNPQNVHTPDSLSHRPAMLRKLYASCVRFRNKRSRWCVHPLFSLLSGSEPFVWLFGCSHCLADGSHITRR